MGAKEPLRGSLLQAILQAVAAGAPQLPSPADQAAEIARLKRDLDRTRMERDVLKKAIGIFAEAPR